MQSFEIFEKIINILNSAIGAALVIIIIYKPESISTLIDAALWQFESDQVISKLIFIFMVDIMIFLNLIRVILGFYFDWQERKRNRGFT